MTTWSTGEFRTIDHELSLALAALAPASLRECLGYKPAVSRRHADAPGGASPSGKAPVFGTGIRRFESCRPSQHLARYPQAVPHSVPHLECLFLKFGHRGIAQRSCHRLIRIE